MVYLRRTLRFAGEIETDMKKVLKHLTVALMIASAVITPLDAYAKGWESVKTERTDAKTIAKDQDIEIRVSRGEIIIISSRQIHVKVFSILGQLISSETIPPGISRLPIAAHGVYIIKTDDLTCKVAV